MRSSLVVVGLGHRHSGCCTTVREERCTAELHAGAVWNISSGACVICSVSELHNCPESMCTGELHAGALLEMWHFHAIWVFENLPGQQKCLAFGCTFGLRVCVDLAWFGSTDLMAVLPAC